jgi:hypothetical protein
MSVFVVIGSINPAAIGAAVEKQYGANHYKLANNVWFVPDSGTTKDVSDKLGISDNRLNAQGVVLRFDGYAGYAQAESWRWIASQAGTIANG